MKRFASLLLVIILFIQTFSFTASATDTREYILANDIANSWRYKDGKQITEEYAIAPAYVASHPDATLQGIDVSHHQGKIDWEKVKASGIDFAIIRCGYAENNPAYDDPRWEYNASECERLGIPYGVYLYSYAESLADALSEAEHVLRLIEGRNLSFPVFYDMEDTKMLGHDLAAMAKVFCDRISEMGHPVGVYANRSWWENYLTNPCFDSWYKWVAEWNESCKYKEEYTIWQYHNKGKVSGISTDVDMNYLIGYPNDHKGWTEKLDTPQLSISSAPSSHPLLSWDSVQSAIGYQIWRKVGSDYYSLIDTVNGTSFADYNVVSGTEYRYMIKAVSADNVTGNSYFCQEKTIVYINDCSNQSGHKYSENAVPPTCTEEGYTVHTCEYCGKSYTDTYVEPVGHTEVVDTEAVEPDCINTGLTASTYCSVCNAPVAKQETVAALGHSFNNYISNGDGTKTSKCDRCDETKTINLTDVAYSGNHGDNIEWEITGQDILYINGVGNMENSDEYPWLRYKDTIIDLQISKNISTIADNAFEGCVLLKEIIISETVTSIGAQAFKGCTSLEYVSIPDNVTSIGANAFDNNVDIRFVVNRNSAAHTWLIENGFTNLDVKVALESIHMPEKIDIAAGETTQIIAELYPYDTTDEVLLEWQVKDERVAVYDAETSTLTAVGPGVTEITVSDTISGLFANSTVNAVLPEGVDMTVTLSEDSEKIGAAGLEFGDSRQLTVSSDVSGVISADMIEFTSSDTSAVTVDENGVITSLCTSETPVSVTITATLKNDASEKAEFTVKAVTKQMHEVPVEIQPVEPVNGYNMELTVTEDNQYKIIVPYEMVKNSPLTFEISGQFDNSALEDSGVKTPAVIWNSDNKSVATVKGIASSKGYKAQITVAKGTKGTATVTVTAKDINRCSTSVEIEVRDYTPGLSANTVTLNSYKTEGAGIKLYTQYNTKVVTDTETPSVQIKGSDKFTAEYNPQTETVIIKAKDTVANNSKGYKVTLAVNTDKGITEQPVTIKVANSLPKVTVKQKGVFNTFFKDSQVFTSVTSADATINSISLAGTDSFSAEQTEGGINITFAEDYQGSTVDSSATVEVGFEGYKVTSKVKYTITSKETKPNLVLSKTSDVYTYLNTDSDPVVIKDKKTGDIFKITDNNWNLLSGGEIFARAEKSGDGIKFTPLLNENNRFTNGKTSHTVKFELQEENWRKPVGFSYTMTISTAKPTVTIKPGTVTINGAGTDSVTVKVIPADSRYPQPTRYIIEPDTTKAAIKSEMEKIHIAYDGWQITAGFKDINDLPENGSYRYKVKAVIPVENGEEVLKTAYLVVKVNTPAPKVTLAKTAVTVNPQIKESVSFAAKINAGYVIEDIQFVANSSTAQDKLDLCYDNGKVTVKTTDANLANGTYSYKAIAKVKADKTDAQIKEISAGTFKVVAKNGKAKIKTTSSGSLDLAVREKGITYTVTGTSNINYANIDISCITDVYLTGTDAELFTVAEVGCNSKNQLKILVLPKSDALMDAGKIYRYSIALKAESVEGEITSSTFSPKTKQSALKLTVKGDTTVYRSRHNGSIDISVKSPAKAKIADIRVVDTLPTTVPKGAMEFNVVCNDQGVYTIDYTVVNKSKLKADKSYKLALKVTPQGNGANKAPQTVYVTLKVKR